MGDVDFDIIEQFLASPLESSNERLHFLLFARNRTELLPTSSERGIEWFYRLVRGILSVEDPIFARYDDEEKNRLLRPLNTIYNHAKHIHDSQHRDGGERYFQHLVNVALISLLELPNPNLRKIFISLYHDSREDTNISLQTIRENCGKYGEYVAEAVDHLSKKDVRLYITNSEMQQLSSFTWKDVSQQEFEDFMMIGGKLRLLDLLKERRNLDYYKSMQTLDEDTLSVKFADRLHNLRTLRLTSPEKINRKFIETFKYFLPVAKKRNMTAYKLMFSEMVKLMDLGSDVI